jgi:hypothetical protein
MTASPLHQRELHELTHIYRVHIIEAASGPRLALITLLDYDTLLVLDMEANVIQNVGKGSFRHCDLYSTKTYFPIFKTTLYFRDVLNGFFLFYFLPIG